MSPRMKLSQSPLQFVPVRDCSNAERMLAATGFTPLLVILESMTSKPKADGGSKNGVAWKVEKAVNYFVQADKVTTDCGYGLGKRATATGGLPRMVRCAAPLQPSLEVFKHLLATDKPRREWGRMLVLHIQNAGE